MDTNLKYNTLHQKIQNDDQKAFQALFDLLWKRLFRFAKSIVMNEDVAKDIVQEVWIDYWNRRKRIETICIEAYLYKAVRFSVYKYLRDNKLNTVQEEVVLSITADSEVTLAQDLESTERKIKSVLMKLPARCREIFTLSREEGMNNNEIASYFGISKRTVENQLTFALKKLRETLLFFL